MGALNLLITGARGNLGRATVKAARARGHLVRALVRRPAEFPDGVAPILCDLAQPGPELARAVQGVDAVLHLAASLSGDDRMQTRDTLAATRALYEALAPQVPVVLAGSIAVYQGCAGVIDEASALDPDLAGRDAYARAKAAQEDIAREFSRRGISTTVLRIGALTGAGQAWRAHVGVTVGPALLRLAGRGELPLVGLADAALALVLAAEQRPRGLQVFNIVASDLPDARAWLAAQPAGLRPAVTLPLPWRLLLPVALGARVLGLPVPGLLRPATLRYRFAPRHFANARARQALGWTPGPVAP